MHTSPGMLDEQKTIHRIGRRDLPELDVELVIRQRKGSCRDIWVVEKMDYR